MHKRQKSLKRWTAQKWRTRDGKPARRRTRSGKTTTARYLPDAAWKSLTPGQAKATDAKKRGGKGQHVRNTKAARVARRRS